ncbi:SDR family NAD(P)-dependent oxidoreductase [Phytohabitans sp. ZYX-F-186]|uniref:SDR family NAD(P)-dependent oxidoreductase n=1 Tax=Phytohabitans maris TaxID=3071409 RepID=A0ABU0ZRY1_9ACTN|nr:SDR family NAD(P)-dependent oxidoreductase [Phytohabitans sp. ZYX-F-186]MDQ7909776.1 SDR family NAD(P)-dependent oxidoreductase [Phytohabitans sp. ZYX-F-186]
MSVDYRSQTVLVTGASSGIGAAFAAALAGRGANLVLVARRAELLTSLADELRRAYGVRVEALPFDLAHPAAGSELRKAVADRGVEVTSLINNAAFGTFARFADADPGRLATEIAVNAAAPVQLTAAFMPQMSSAANGFIVNVAGVSAYLPSPRMAVYSATKAFVLSFSESLWTELRGTGLTAFAVCPGATDTEFTTGMGPGAGVLTSGRTRRPEDVVATALAHLERRDPGPVVVDGRSNRLGVLMSRLASRRRSAMMMERVFDPDRRSKPAAA